MKLNEYTDKTKENIHLLVTPLCDRDCPHCCNKQYDLNEIPFVTDEELRNAKTLYLTGGEPFKYSSPNNIARWYKLHYPNIQKVIVYTNAYELNEYVQWGGQICYIDGLDINIKAFKDMIALFRINLDNTYPNLRHSRLYNFFPIYSNLLKDYFKGFMKVYDRTWQEDFKPADDSIFRRM